MSVIEKRLPEEKLKNLSKSRPFSRGRKLRCRSRRERETSFEFKLRKFLDISNTYLHNLLNFTYLGRKEDLHICTTKPLEERHSRWISEIFIGNDSISHSPRSAASRSEFLLCTEFFNSGGGRSPLPLKERMNPDS